MGSSVAAPWVVLCTLSPGPSCAQWGFGCGGLCFDGSRDQSFSLKVNGPGTVHVTGHFSAAGEAAATPMAVSTPAAVSASVVSSGACHHEYQPQNSLRAKHVIATWTEHVLFTHRCDAKSEREREKQGDDRDARTLAVGY